MTLRCRLSLLMFTAGFRLGDAVSWPSLKSYSRRSCKSADRNRTLGRHQTYAFELANSEVFKVKSANCFQMNAVARPARWRLIFARPCRARAFCCFLRALFCMVTRPEFILYILFTELYIGTGMKMLRYIIWWTSKNKLFFRIPPILIPTSNLLPNFSPAGAIHQQNNAFTDHVGYVFFIILLSWVTSHFKNYSTHKAT